MASGEEAWEGCYKAVVAAPISRVWEITSDFSGLASWTPSLLSSCPLVEGHNNQAGALRRCIGADGAFLGSERLLTFDAEGYCFSYKVEETNLPGLVGYVATFHLSPDPLDALSTHVTWSYRVAPIPSSSPHELQTLIFGIYQLCLSDLAKFLS